MPRRKKTVEAPEVAGANPAEESVEERELRDYEQLRDRMAEKGVSSLEQVNRLIAVYKEQVK